MKNVNTLSAISQFIETAVKNESLAFDMIKAQSGTKLTSFTLELMVNVKFAKTAEEKANNQKVLDMVEMEKARRYLEKAAA